MNKIKAVIYMIISAFSFSIMQIVVKFSVSNIPIMEQVFIRNFFTLFIGLYIAKKAGVVNLFGKRENRKALMWRALFGYIGVVMYFYASRSMLAADAALLHRSSPFFVALFSCLFLKEKFTKTHILSFILAGIGAVMVVRPQFNSSLFPAVMGLMSSITSGGAYTIIAFLKGKENNGVIIFYFSLLSCVLSLPFMVADFTMPDAYDGFMLVLIGVFASFGQVFLTMAYKNAPAGEVSIYNFSGIIFSCLMGIAVFGEIPDVFSICGIAVLIAAAMVLFTKEKKSKQTRRS